jgi:hypothetical protein
MKGTIVTSQPRTARLSSAPTLLEFARWAARTTPGRLWTALAVIWLTEFVFFLAGRVGLSHHLEGVRTVGKDAAPSVIAAQRVKAELAGMYASAARELLTPTGQKEAVAKEFDERRRAVTEGLMTAAGNITYGDSERVPIRTMLQGLGPYEGAISQARLLHGRGDPGFVEPLRNADAFLNDSLLPAADALDQANRRALDAGYDRARGTASSGLAWLLSSGLVALGALIGTQVSLTRRTRRLVNPALALASVAVTVLIVALGSAFVTASSQLRRAKADCFESIHVLERARADGYEMLAAERLALLDPARAETYAKRFRDRRDRIITQAPGGTIDSLTASVVAQRLPSGAGRGGDVEGVPRAWGEFARANLPQAVQGHLASELRNITFVGEREAAVDTLRTFAEFVAADSRVAQLAAKEKRADAVSLALSDKPGGAVRAIQDFDTALGRTLKINHREFGLAVDRGFAVLTRFGVLTPMVALGVVLLASAGLRPRLKEYAP